MAGRGGKRIFDVVISGAGLSGVATAHALAAKHNIRRVLLVDPRPPVSATSSVSTECYRDFWPTMGPMRPLVNRSIELMEKLARETGNEFYMTRRGYIYLRCALVVSSKVAELRLTDLT